MKALKNFVVFILIFALITALMIFGLTFYVKMTENDVPEVEEGELEEVTLLANIRPGHLDDLEGYVIPALEEADGKYLWLDEDWKIYGMSKEALQEKFIEGYHYEGKANPMSRHLGVYLTMTKMAFENFTDGYNTCTYDYTYYGFKFGETGRLIKAFGDVFPVDECLSDQYHNDNPLKEKGLNLDMQNVEVEKIMFCPMISQYNYFIVQVGADVKCQKRSEAFDGLDWIPEEGETEHVTFTALCFSYNFGFDGIYPVDIVAVKG